MKRNITVNIFGSLYPMDEDAYAMLNAYIANMRDYFSRQSDGKEIADDIEGRIAELMTEFRQQGTEAISINHVEEIISRVGNPEEFTDEDEVSNKEMPPIPASVSKKKLFRDPEHKILGGVFAGIGCYLGVNPLWLRLVFILMAFPSLVYFPLFLFLCLLYIVCWMSIPMAKTSAERLEMKGENVNLSNLCSEFLSSTREMMSRTNQWNNGGGAIGVMVSLLKWCCYALGILLISACIIGFISLVVSMTGILSYPWTSLREIIGENSLLMLIIDSNPVWLLWVAAVSIFVFLATSLYATAHFTLRLLGRVRPLSTPLRVVCVTLWIASIVVCTASCSKIAGHTSHYIYFKTHHSAQSYEENTIEKQLEMLNSKGWNLTKALNVRNYSNRGEHFSGNKNVSYLDAALDDKDSNMEYEAVRELKVAPGIYRLEAKARANGEGSEIFAVNGAGERMVMPIPACGNKGGSVWINAKLALDSDTAHLLPNRDYLNKIAKVNNSRGFGWESIEIDDIIVGTDSIVRYGVTNISDSHTWDGTWLSASSFELKKIK